MLGCGLAAGYGGNSPIIESNKRQRKGIAREITEADAHYAPALKANQGNACAEIKIFLDDAIQNRNAGRGKILWPGWGNSFLEGQLKI